MVRKLLPVLALAVMLSMAALLVAAFQTAKASSDDVSVTKTEKVSNVSESIQNALVEAAAGVEQKALLSHRSEPVPALARHQRVDVVYLGNYEETAELARGKPKLTTYRGLGHNHFARAEI